MDNNWIKKISLKGVLPIVVILVISLLIDPAISRARLGSRTNEESATSAQVENFKLASTSMDDSNSTSSNWKEFNYKADGSRYNKEETTLTKGNISNLEVKWFYPTPNASVPGGVSVVDNILYFGDQVGRVYAVKDLGTGGQELWKTQLDGGAIFSAPLLTGNMVIVTAMDGYVFALDKNTGSVLWKSQELTGNVLPEIFNSAIRAKDKIILGLGAGDEGLELAGIDCCLGGRGSVVALDINNGNVVWQDFLIPDSLRDDPFPGTTGAVGVNVWGTPAYSPETNMVYVGTGQHYASEEEGGKFVNTSDALIAYDLDTGERKWIYQATAGDWWRFGVYRFADLTRKQDWDFGDSPNVYKLDDGRIVVGAGQKEGSFHVVDARTGQLVNKLKLGVATGMLGAINEGSAHVSKENENDAVVYTSVFDFPVGKEIIPDPDGSNYFTNFYLSSMSVEKGEIAAIKGDASAEICRLQLFPQPGGPTHPLTGALVKPISLGGLAVANGIVFAPTTLGTIVAMDGDNCQKLTEVRLTYIPNAGFSISIANGRVYAGNGYDFAAAFGAPMMSGGVYALGI